MRERAVERKLFLMVRQLGGRAIKLRNTTYNGDPDRILVLPNGVTLYAEVKRPKQRPRASQQRVHRWFRRKGHTVLIVDGTNWHQVFTYMQSRIIMAARRA